MQSTLKHDWAKRTGYVWVFLAQNAKSVRSSLSRFTDAARRRGSKKWVFKTTIKTFDGVSLMFVTRVI